MLPDGGAGISSSGRASGGDDGSSAVSGRGGATDGAGGSSDTGGQNASGGQTGTAGAASFDCHEDGSVKGTPATTVPAISDSDCHACLKERCPSAFANCFATQPNSVCGYAEAVTFDGEFAKAYECLFDAYAQGTGDFNGSQADIDACLTAKPSAVCGKVAASSVTRALVECMAGLRTPTTNCMVECSLK